MTHAGTNWLRTDYAAGQQVCVRAGGEWLKGVLMHPGGQTEGRRWITDPSQRPPMKYDVEVRLLKKGASLKNEKMSEVEYTCVVGTRVNDQVTYTVCEVPAAKMRTEVQVIEPYSNQTRVDLDTSSGYRGSGEAFAAPFDDKALSVGGWRFAATNQTASGFVLACREVTVSEGELGLRLRLGALNSHPHPHLLPLPPPLSPSPSPSFSHPPPFPPPPLPTHPRRCPR